MTDAQNHFVESTVAAFETLQAEVPLVQCITNSVVTNFTANVLLAVGAAPAMADVPVEAGEFAAVASGVLINVGTPHADQREAMIEAAESANAADTPWVLDPVAVGGLSVRTLLAGKLRDLSPTIIRGNASEILALAGTGAGGRGVDSTDEAEGAVASATQLSRDTGAVVAISGPTDIVVSADRIVRLTNGHPYLTQVTGGGCALGAVIAAFASVGSDRLETTAAAVSVYTVAADLAAENSSGPGSFAVNFLDALANVTSDDLRVRATFS